MPIEFDSYERSGDEGAWVTDPETNGYRILEFLAPRPDMGFTPKEIHDATGVARGSVGTTLRRLEERELVRHKEPFWAIDERGLESLEATVSGLHAVEASTTYDWGDDSPETYRIGLDAVRDEQGNGD